MRVLVACEFSGVVRDAFASLGHDAYSCDLLPSERFGQHIQGDALNYLEDGWDLMIAHPPCTHLAVSGARHFARKQAEQLEALKFVRFLMDAPIPRICVENPISVISSRIRKPDQIIQPFIGFGIGMGYTKWDVSGVFPRTVSTVAGGASLVNIDSLAIHDRASSVAAQGIVGFTWKATDRLNLDLTYRYSGLDRIRLNTKTTGSVYGVFFNNTNGSGPGTVGPFVGRHLINQSATIGLRYAWGAAPR